MRSGECPQPLAESMGLSYDDLVGEVIITGLRVSLRRFGK
jgi:hypothetical protein